MKTPFRKDTFHALPPLPELTNSVGQIAGGEIWKSDAVDLVKTLPDSSVDLIVTDPAYQSLEKWRALGTTTRLKQSKASSNAWFKTFPNERYYDLFAQFFRVLKPGSHLYMFCDEETRDLVCTGYSPQTDKYIVLGEAFSGLNAIPLGHGPLLSAGFKYWKSLVWDKEIRGMGYHFPAQHEFILMAEKVKSKGKHRQLNFNAIGDVIAAKRLKGKEFYPTEKPFTLIEILIRESSNERDTVLDPFTGSGVVGQVCRKTNRKFILGDINPEEAIRRLTK